MTLSSWCSRIIRYSFFLLFLLVPLLLTPWNYELFEYNKMMITYGLTAVITGAWIIKMFADGEIRIARTPLDIPLGLFVFSQFVSALYSIDPHVSWFGYYSRFNGGMWSILTYALLYVAYVSNFSEPSGQSAATALNHEPVSKKKGSHSTVTAFRTIPSSAITTLKISLSSAFIVALYGVAEHYGIDKHLWVQDVQSRVFSTLGQPNWLAAFLVALLPISMVFALAHSPVGGNGKSWSPGSLFKHSIWSLITLILFIVLLHTRSRSGLAGFAAADVILWILLLLGTPRKKHYVPTMILMHAAFAVVVFFNGSNIVQIDRYITLNGIRNALAERKAAPVAPVASAPAYTAPLLEVGGTESGTIRKYVWSGAISAWKSTTKTLLIGTGTETFAFAFYRFRPAGHNLTSEWDFLYNKAHNEYLNYLATTGMFGLGSYLLFIATFSCWFLVWWFKHRTGDPEANTKAAEFTTLTISLFAGWISVLVTNFFGFSVVILQLFLFLFPAMVFVFLASDGSYRMHFFTKRVGVPAWIRAMTALLCIIVVVRIALFWYADVLYASGYRDARSGQYARAKESIERALVINPGEPNYHDEYASTLGTFAAAASGQQNATMAAALAQQALAENEKAIAISPQNVNYWKTQTKLYYTFASFDPALNDKAIGALVRAETLSPNDPKIYYNLAILFGRGGNNAKAIELLQKAKTLKPNYHDAYYALYIFHSEDKKPDAARTVLEEYLRSVDPSDKQFTQILEGK